MVYRRDCRRWAEFDRPDDTGNEWTGNMIAIESNRWIKKVEDF